MKFKIGLIFIALIPINFAFADDGWPDFEFRAGGYIATFDSELRINDSDDIRGTDTDVEDVLDVDDGLEKFRLDARWRFLPKHALELTYYDISRDGGRVIDRQVTIGDQTFDVGTDVETEIDFEVYKFAYAYSFYQTDATDMSISLGIHAIDFGVAVEGKLLNVPVAAESRDVVLPLPVVGVSYMRRLGGPFSIGVDVDVFAIEYDDYKGSLWDANVTLDVDFTERFGAYLGYNFVDMQIKSEDDDLLGKLDYQYGAVMAGLRLKF